VAWRPALASAVMGAALWLLRDRPALMLVGVAAVVYLAVLALVGGFSQPDMGLMWRLVPLERLLTRVRPKVRHT